MESEGNRRPLYNVELLTWTRSFNLYSQIICRTISRLHAHRDILYQKASVSLPRHAHGKPVAIDTSIAVCFLVESLDEFPNEAGRGSTRTLLPLQVPAFLSFSDTLHDHYLFQSPLSGKSGSVEQGYSQARANTSQIGVHGTEREGVNEAEEHLVQRLSVEAAWPPRSYDGEA